MIKKICLGLSLIICSCTATNINHNPESDNKAIVSPIPESDNKIISSNLDVKSLFSLKKEIEENENVYFKGAYFDEYNNGIIFLNNSYYVIKDSEYKKYDLPDRLKGKNFNNVSLDKNGNGFGFSLPDTIGISASSEIIKFKDFAIIEVKYIDENINSYPYVINVYDNYFGKGYGVSYKNSLDFFDIQEFFNYKIINSYKFSEFEKVGAIILNNLQKGFIFTKEEINNNVKNKLYSVKDNNLFLMNIDSFIGFKENFNSYGVTGKINNNGDGFIHYDDKINLIDNYNIVPEVKTIDNSLLSYIDMNKKGDGFIIHYEKFNSNPYLNLMTPYFYNISGFKTENNNRALIDFGVSPLAVKYAINNQGNGFLLFSGDKTNTNERFKYNNKFYLLINYKIIDKV